MKNYMKTIKTKSLAFSNETFLLIFAYLLIFAVSYLKGEEA
jgi:hypothetical protein